MKRSEILNICASAIGLVSACFGFGWILQHHSRHAIAVIPQTTAQEIWESEHAGAARAASESGWSIYWNGPSREDDFTRQIQIVNQEIERRVDGLVLAPDHAVALISPVRNALAHNIPCVVVSSPLGISPGGMLSYVLNDEARFNNNPWDPNFGKIFPGQTRSADAPPRNLNVLRNRGSQFGAGAFSTEFADCSLCKAGPTGS